MPSVYIGLGTNLGNKDENLNKAILQLIDQAGNVILKSSFYISKPWGFESDNQFLNAVVLIETELSPFQLLTKIKKIEKNMGRISKSREGYHDRVIDIDILLYGSLIVDTPKLKIPHPYLTERDFAMLPLTEIAPHIVHPVSGKYIIDYLKPDNYSGSIES
jgi:2-amino-4-hydroxy-6-hydroxymethyldihydropteridine diphosphokinase